VDGPFRIYTYRCFIEARDVAIGINEASIGFKAGACGRQVTIRRITRLEKEE
jgi:hypothetical protein